MVNAPLPVDEALRLRVLREYDVLDSAPDHAYDDITALLAELLGVPISLVSLVDETRQWFKSHHGLAATSTPREHAFCAHAILTPGDLFEVPDAWADRRFADNPLVTGAPFIRFYAGVPLVSPEGQALGTLNVIDRVPRRLDAQQRRLLQVLGRQVTAQLALRRVARELAREAVDRHAAEVALRRDYEAMLEDERRMRHQIDEMRRFGEHLFDVLPTLLYVYDCRTRRNVFANHDVAALLGHAPDSHGRSVAAPLTRYMHPDDLPRFALHLRQVAALAGKDVAEVSYRLRHADGHWRWFHSRDAVMRRDGRVVQQIVGSATDVTALRELEQHQHAREVAEQANRAKSSFVARMSHELRTPLNGVLGFAQLLQVGSPALADDRQRTYVHHIEQAGRHLLSLIDETLDLAGIESGNVALTMQEVDLAAVLDTCLSLVQEQAHQAALSLAAELGEVRGVQVQADERRLRQVVLNLLSNAIKYNRAQGSVRLGARVEAGRARVEVADTGRGLTEAQLARLFEPFNRLGAEATCVAGTGLGLAISKNLVDQMGGTLDVASEPGVGSRFTLALPLAWASPDGSG